MQQSIILEQLSFLVILVLIGLFASKLGIIKSETRDSLVKIIFNITLPLLLFTNFSRLSLTPEILTNSLIVIIMSFAAMVLMLLVGYLTSGFFTIKHEKRSIYIVHHAFGNILYFGFPVINALFGELGLFYASIYTFVSIMLLWTVGVYIITRNREHNFRESLIRMINPNSVAILAGFTLFLLQIKIPGIFLKPFQSLGGTTIYLSMLYIGALLGLMDMKGIFTNKLVYITTLNKNILFPFLLVGIFYLFIRKLGWNLDPMIVSVVILEAAMPCMANIVIVAKIFKVDDQLATSNVFLSTLMSMFTLPLIWYMLSRFII